MSRDEDKRCRDLVLTLAGGSQTRDPRIDDGSEHFSHLPRHVDVSSLAVLRNHDAPTAPLPSPCVPILLQRALHADLAIAEVEVADLQTESFARPEPGAQQGEEERKPAGDDIDTRSQKLRDAFTGEAMFVDIPLPLCLAAVRQPALALRPQSLGNVPRDDPRFDGV